MCRAVLSAVLVVLFADQACSAPPKPLDLDAFGYDTPEVRVDLQRFLDTARKTAGEGWTHRILSTSTDRRNFIAQWCKTVDRRQQCLIYRPSNMESVHGINIYARSAGSVGQRPILKGFSLEANQQASPKAWAVTMTYQHFPEGRIFQLELARNEMGGWPAPDIVFPSPSFHHVVEFEGVAHQVDIRLPDPYEGHDWDAEIPKMLASPESLRDTLLADLDRLERQIEKPILTLFRGRRGASHSGISTTRTRREAKKMRLIPNRHLDNLNFREVEPSVTLRTEAHCREVLELVRTWLESRRAFVRDDAEAIYRDVLVTFPIAECLGDR
jgi:hypothetical protein